MKSLLVVYSYHHHNTDKIAKVIAEVLKAEIKSPLKVNPEELQAFNLVGFGSGIYHGKHHPLLLNLADKLSPVTNRNAFIFSTCGVPAIGLTDALRGKNHSQLREKLQTKGYRIIDEFSCVGFNTNSFLKYFGGINKGRPNAGDLDHAEKFAKNLKRKVEENPL